MKSFAEFFWLEFATNETAGYPVHPGADRSRILQHPTAMRYKLQAAHEEKNSHRIFTFARIGSVSLRSK
jgi:hypothetical protein